MKLYKKNYYIIKDHPGISGFQQWNQLEYRVCTGYKAMAHDRTRIVRQFLENGRGQFALEDGHLPGYQPVVKEKEVIPWLEKNLYRTAFILNPEVYGLTTHVNYDTGGSAIDDRLSNGLCEDPY